MAFEMAGIYEGTRSGVPSPESGSTRLRRKESSPCVYIDNAVRNEGNVDEPRIPQAFNSSTDAAPVRSVASCGRSHELETSPTHEDKPFSGEVPGEPSVEGTNNMNEEADACLAIDNGALPDSVAREVEKSQHTKALPQKGTKRKRSRLNNLSVQEGFACFYIGDISASYTMQQSRLAGLAWSAFLEPKITGASFSCFKKASFFTPSCGS